ncbi:MAG: hypothetical protein Q9227_004437 [Pyrenula ochraceoflavens]
MGSISDDLTIELETPCGRIDPNLSPETFVETVWAITNFVYTGDSSVRFLRCAAEPSKGRHDGAAIQPSPSVRNFRFSQDATPAEIAKTSDGFETEDGDTWELDHDASAPAMTQVIRRAAVLVTQNYTGFSLKRGFGKDNFERPFRATLVADDSEYRESLRGILNTIERVSQVLMDNWHTPLRQLDFLASENWLQIVQTAPITAKINSSIMSDILVRQNQIQPDGVALEAWDGILTYAELYELSRRMAALLLQKGVLSEDRIGICMKKSKWSVVAFWGILLSGCTGVPLDIRNPRNRMEALLRKVDARFVVADLWTEPELRDLDCGILLCQSDVLEDISTSCPPISWPQPSPRTVAFILFTSGSTGLPKGVIIEHGPLYASVVEIAAELFLEKTTRTFQFSSFVSDASIGDIFATMLKGGCVCMPSEEERLDNLSAALNKSCATHVCLTSSVMSQIQPKEVPHLKYMIAIGEALSKENFLRWNAHIHTISAYGIAESIIYDSFASPKHLSTDYRNIGLARGPCLWVVDQNDPHHLKPIGAVGEILIEGPLLARGYINDPEQTAKKFIQAPPWLQHFRGKKENLLCYRSGDLGIRNGDGTILYLGRADTQVKIRGQRVELSEIEHGLLIAEPRLQEVVVEAVELQNRGNAQVLVSFVAQPCGGGEESPPLLPMHAESQRIFQNARLKLLETFPRYMVPSLFIPVKNIPKNTVGKRDRNTLRRWGAGLTDEQLFQYQLRDSSTYRPPESAEERVLQRLWAKLFHTNEDSLGADDNFFQVGGDSLKAIELVAALREHGLAMTVSEIFQSPTMSEMANILKLIDEDASEQPPKPFELIQASCAVEKSLEEAARACKVSVEEIEDIYPATPMQEALMAVSARRKNFYTHRLVFRVPETLDVVRFRKAWEILVSEQSIFRTRIAPLPELGTVQIVVANSGLDWHERMSLDEFLRYDDTTPFTNGSALNRFAVVSDGSETPHFVWSGHHAISDGWSRPAMFEEIRHIYDRGFARHHTPYTQFIRHLNQADNEVLDDFWKEQFSDTVEPFPQLPNPGCTPHAQQMQILDVGLERKLSSTVTTATLIQAAWSLVTATYANTNEAGFGLTLSGRDAPVPGLTKMLGITITTVPVRIVFDNTDTISQFLESVQQYISLVKQHQHIGLQRLYRLSPEARLAASFQNLLVIQPVDEDKDHESLAHLGLQLVQREERDTRDHALTVQCTVDKDRGSVRVKAHYDNEVLSDGQINSLLAQFKHVINQLATESTSRTLYDLDKMSPHDLNLLATWNKEMPLAVEKTLHVLFEERAREAPEAIALDGFDGRMTYAELDQRSDQLASYLQRHAGIDRGSRVLLCFVKSKIPIIVMLATLKSGGTCVSTNPEHPTTRLLELSKDVAANVVLCDKDSVNRFEGHGTCVIGITESLLTELKVAAVCKNVSHALENDVAFIVYTSGSTGRPKGSMLEHRSLATDFTALGQRVGLNPMSRTLQFSAYTFDAHILEIFGTLIHGGCVCIISDHERMDCLSDVINERQVNFALLTKTVSRLLEPEDVPTLESLILSGEPNGRQDYERWARRVSLFNGLGPSECTPLVCLTRNPVQSESRPANIGHPMACRIWITDHRRPDRLVPIGCIGEMTVEGPIVGRGYVNRPRETAASFIHAPAWAKDRSGRARRFYRSGDLAKMNFDGSITFIGRADGQIKINGQRVELGEIEDQLRRCSPTFKNSAVDAITISSRGGAKILAVFCSCGSTSRNNIERNSSESPILPIDENIRSEFREAQIQLTRILPQYMVPSLFIPVNGLPFNASGKLERKMLRGWVADFDPAYLYQHYLTTQTAPKPPETDREKILQALWGEVLETPSSAIHLDDNFFRLGGDSVLSMKLVANARGKGFSMTVADIFRAPLLKDMALSMSESEKLNNTKVNRSITPEQMSLVKDKVDLQTCIKDAAQDCGVTVDMIEDIYPCNPSQEALMAVSSHRPKAYTYQVVLKLPKSVDIGRFKSSWEMLVNTHAIYRTRIIFRRGVGSLQVALRSQLKWHNATGISFQEYIQREEQRHIGYGSELCKFATINHCGETIFVLTLHHALYDGESLRRTYRELSYIYQNGTAQTPIIPYTMFFQHLSTIGERESDDFWRSQFTDIVKGYPQLPSEQYVPRPQHHKASTFTLGHRLGSDVTLATVIQTAWALLMSMYSGSEETVFGLMLSGRDASVDGIMDIIGPTISTVPVKVNFELDMTLIDILDSMQRLTADIRRYQHAGLHRIRQLSPEANAAADLRNLLVVNTMGDAEITSPLSDLGFQVVETEVEEFLDLALTAECTIRSDTVQVFINYDNAIVADRQVDLMLHQLEHIATILIGDSKTEQLRDIELASSYNIAQLNEWNGNIPDPVHETLHCLVEAQMRATPDSPAIHSFDRDFSYNELDSAANKIAAYLTSIGVGPEKCVVHCFKKSSWAIVASLAILKSGGVCVPLNAENPLSGRLDICEDVEAMAVLCDADREQEFFSHVPHVLAVDDSLLTVKLNENACHDRIRSGPQVTPSNAAFIVYTSGSSGKPKGCILEHHSVSYSQKTYARATNISSTTRQLQYSAFSFDVHVAEIFGTLIHGGCICVISDDERMNDLVAGINARRPNRLWLTPTVAQLIEPSAVPTVDTLILVGETLTQKTIDVWAVANVRVVNWYAPAETSNLGCTNFGVNEQRDSTNIGGPLGCGVWIVDSNNSDRLSPIGCVGELLIEGSVLARGYHKRHDATSTAFIENPVWSRSQLVPCRERRFYKTGDLAYYDHDGCVKFIGRADTQVKIHGQRVELHEIEYQIQKCLPLGNEVVVDLANLGGMPTLTAFIKLSDFTIGKGGDLTVDDNQKLDAFRIVIKELEKTLLEKLPLYMLPSAFIPVSFIPMSTSAKVERKRLRSLAKDLPQDAIFTNGSNDVKQQPTTSTEASLQLVWSQILNKGISDIGTSDTFMALGGDSITAMQVVSECRRLGISLQVSTILQKKTIMDIAPHCMIKPSSEVRSITATEDGVLFNLSPIQKFYLEHESQSPKQFNQTFLCRVKQKISPAKLKRAFDVIVKRHAMLRARFSCIEMGREWMQRTTPMTPGCYRFLSHKLGCIDNGSYSSDATCLDAFARESLSSINVCEGPIFSVDHVDVDGDDDILYLVAHHLAIDLVSWRIVLRDLEEVLKNGNLPNDSLQLLSFQEWVSFQEKRFTSTHVSANVTYPLSIPADLFNFWGVSQEDNILQHEVIESIRLSENVTSLLLGKGNQAMGTTPLDILVGALLYSFRQVFQDRDVPSIHIEHHGREPGDQVDEVDLSQTVGWFTALYPVHVAAASSTTIQEMVRLVKDTRARIPHNGQPYFTFRTLSRETNCYSHHTPMEILVNFSGLFQQLESTQNLLQLESRVAIHEPESDPKSHRFAMINLEAGVFHGVMNLSFHMHNKMAHLDRARTWITLFHDLLNLTLPQLATETPIYTLSDFPRLSLINESLQDLVLHKLPDSGLDAGYGAIEDIYPCTAIQQGILLSQQTDSEAYQLRHIWEFTSDIAFEKNLPSRLAEAWTMITCRHSTLRTGLVEYVTDCCHFIQVLLKKLPSTRFNVSKCAISDMSEIMTISDEDENEFWKHIPRLTVYPNKDGKFACDLKLSHALIDGMSMDIFMDEFISLLCGQSLPTPTLDFSRYVEYEQEQKRDQSVEYWANYLKGAKPCHLPTSHQKTTSSALQKYNYIKLADDIGKDLPALCQQLGVTQAILIQIAWAIVLGMHTGQDDVCFGYLASGRDAPLDGIERSVGLFISMQVCRLQISTSVKDLVQGVYHDVIAGLEHRNCSLALIQNKLGLKTTPLFNSCITVRRGLDETSKMKRRSLSKTLDIPERTEYAIALNASVGPNGAQIGMSYEVDKISSNYATSIAALLETVVRSLSKNETHHLRAGDLVSEHIRKFVRQNVSQFAKVSSEERACTLNSVPKKQAKDEIERDLQAVWAKVLHYSASAIGLNDTFMSLGGDSIAAMQIVAQCRKIGIRLRVSTILQKMTIAAIAPSCDRTSNETSPMELTKAGDNTHFSLSPIQKRYFDHQPSNGRIQFNQSLLCRVKQSIPVEKLKEAFDRIVTRHAMLRARFVQTTNKEWRQFTLPAGKDVYRFVPHYLGGLSEEISRLAGTSSQALDIVEGPLFSVDYINLPDMDGMIFLAAHHLVVDIVSWQVILRELEEIIQSGNSSTSVAFTYQQWCSIQEAESIAKISADEVLPVPVPPSNYQYWQIPAEENVSGDTVEESFKIPASITGLLLDKSNKALGTIPLEILLGPLLSSFCEFFPDRDVPSAFIEHHGREACNVDDVELSQVVGWFTSMYPVHVLVGPDTSAVEAVQRVKERRRKVPQNGRPYLVYRHLNTEGTEKFSQHEPVELLVNFSGIFRRTETADSLIKVESRMDTHISDADPIARRWAMIGVEVNIWQGELAVTFLLNKKMAHITRVRRWINAYKERLCQAATDLAEQSQSYTLNDFPLLEISNVCLNDLISNELPRLGIEDMDTVEDILSCAPFQKCAIEGNVATPPRHWNDFYFQLPSDIDVQKLQQACVQLIQHHSILRTLFVKSTEGFLQVVLKSLDPKIDTYQSDEDITMFMERVFLKDLADLPPLGESALRFIIIRTPKSARLLMRLSHAQFDALSRTAFVKTLATLYDNGLLPESVSYADFIQTIKRHQEEGCNYWRKVLAGAQPTAVIKITPQPRYKDTGVIRAEKTIPSFRTLNGVTSATVFNSACAILLHSLTGSSDIIFGRLTSGRAALDPRFHNLVGPCINIIPVRVRLGLHFTPPDVLQQVHSQHIESIPHETVGLDDIIEKCTDWSTSMAKFPVITQHLNQEDGSEVETSSHAKFTANTWDPSDVDPFPWSFILGSFPSQCGVKISITTNSKLAEQTLIDRALEDICGIIDSITSA